MLRNVHRSNSNDIVRCRCICVSIYPVGHCPIDRGFKVLKVLTSLSEVPMVFTPLSEKTKYPVTIDIQNTHNCPLWCKIRKFAQIICVKTIFCPSYSSLSHDVWGTKNHGGKLRLVVVGTNKHCFKLEYSHGRILKTVTYKNELISSKATTFRQQDLVPKILRTHNTVKFSENNE